MIEQSSEDVVSTPSSKRITESDEYVHDLTSTSKKQRTKNIKSEQKKSG